MSNHNRIDSDLPTRTRRSDSKVRRHKLPVCDETGLARYRDRHQARDGAKALSAGERNYETSTFACPACRGFHVETTYYRTPIVLPDSPTPTAAYTESVATRKRRYWLVDVENPSCGAKWSCEQVAQFFDVLKRQAPGIAPQDHVVVAAARYVRRKYRHAIVGENVKWVTGADAPDGADRAALAAIDLYRVTRDFDELVIVSGDHAFVDLAKRAKQAGLSVHVVTAQAPEGRPMLSRELAAVADLRTFVRLESRTQRPDNLTAIESVSSRAHRRVHVETAAA